MHNKSWNTAEHGIDSRGSNPPINKHSRIICIITEQIQTNASYMHQSRSPGLLRRHRWLRWGTFDRCQSNTYTKQEIVTRLVALVRSCIIARTPAMNRKPVRHLGAQQFIDITRLRDMHILSLIWRVYYQQPLHSLADACIRARPRCKPTVLRPGRCNVLKHTILSFRVHLVLF